MGSTSTSPAGDRRCGRDESDNGIGGSEREHLKRSVGWRRSNQAIAGTQFDFATLTGYAERPASLTRCPEVGERKGFFGSVCFRDWRRDLDLPQGSLPYS
jgi:hypothetical protein